MILAKRVKKAFAYDSQGRLSPVGENIFQFKRKKVLSDKSLKKDKSKSNISENKQQKENEYESRDSGSLRQA